jgi:hypothetical protein
MSITHPSMHHSPAAAAAVVVAAAAARDTAPVSIGEPRHGGLLLRWVGSYELAWAALSAREGLDFRRAKGGSCECAWKRGNRKGSCLCVRRGFGFVCDDVRVSGGYPALNACPGCT